MVCGSLGRLHLYLSQKAGSYFAPHGLIRHLYDDQNFVKPTA